MTLDPDKDNSYDMDDVEVIINVKYLMDKIMYVLVKKCRYGEDVVPSLIFSLALMLKVHGSESSYRAARAWIDTLKKSIHAGILHAPVMDENPPWSPEAVKNYSFGQDASPECGNLVAEILTIGELHCDFMTRIISVSGVWCKIAKWAQFSPDDVEDFFSYLKRTYDDTEVNEITP